MDGVIDASPGTRYDRRWASPTQVVLVTDDRGVVGSSPRVHARVRHEPDRSYAVLVEGPDGEVLVGSTRRTGEVLRVGREGAARVFGVPVEQIADDVDVFFPRPPYGREGQWVRIVSVGEDPLPDDLLDVGVAGLAHWFGAEGAWMVSGPRVGGVYPGEYLDFEPVIGAVEAAEMRGHLERAAQPPA